MPLVPFVGAHEFFFINTASVSNPATDVFAITGSATRKVIVHGIKVVLSAPNDTSSLEYLFAARRTGEGTGGTKATNVLVTPMDRTGATATASVFGWTTSPTALGTLLGVVDMEPTASLAGVSPQDPHDARSLLSVPFAFGPPGSGNGITLNGVNDVLAVNMTPGRSFPAGGMPIWAAAYWTEEIL